MYINKWIKQLVINKIKCIYMYMYVHVYRVKKLSLSIIV